VLELLLTQATTRNSTLWADDPKQQIAYLAQKRWARLYCPGVILGVYSVDELETISTEKDVTPQKGSAKQEPEATPILDEATFKTIADKYRESVANGKKSASDFVAWVENKGALMTEAQKAEVASWIKKQPEVVEGEATTVNDDFTAAYEKAESESK
jgi:hypothetical protein